MKLGPDMYHLNTFDIPKHEGVREWAGGALTPDTGGCFLLESNSTFKSALLL